MPNIAIKRLMRKKRVRRLLVEVMQTENRDYREQLVDQGMQPHGKLSPK